MCIRWWIVNIVKQVGIRLIDCSLWFIVMMVVTTVLIHGHLYMVDDDGCYIEENETDSFVVSERNCQKDKVWFDGGGDELLSKRETHIIIETSSTAHMTCLHFLISEMNTLKPRISIFANRYIQSKMIGGLEGFLLVVLVWFWVLWRKNKIDSSKKHNNDKQYFVFFSCLAWSWRFPWAVNWASVNWGESFFLDFFVIGRGGHNNFRREERSCNFSIFCSLIRHSL